MKSEDKEKIIENDEKLPKIAIVKKAAKEPWCAGGAALCVAILAVLVSLGVLIACLGYFGVLPEKVRFKWAKLRHLFNKYFCSLRN